MLRRLLPIAVILAMSSAPLFADAKVRTDYNGAQSYGISVAVQADCTLSLQTTGTVYFNSISGLGGNAPEATPDNPATTYCEADSATMNIYDGNPLNTTAYTLTYDHSADVIPFKVCRNSGGLSCFVNSTIPSYGYPLSQLNDTQQITAIYGYLTGQGPNNPGTYTDVLTVAVSFH